MFFLHKVGQFLDAVDTMGYNAHMGYKLQSQVNYMDIRMLQRNASRLKDLIISRTGFNFAHFVTTQQVLSFLNRVFPQ